MATIKPKKKTDDTEDIDDIEESEIPMAPVAPGPGVTENLKLKESMLSQVIQNGTGVDEDGHKWEAL